MDLWPQLSSVFRGQLPGARPRLLWWGFLLAVVKGLCTNSDWRRPWCQLLSLLLPVVGQRRSFWSVTNSPLGLGLRLWDSRDLLYAGHYVSTLTTEEMGRGSDTALLGGFRSASVWLVHSSPHLLSLDPAALSPGGTCRLLPPDLHHPHPCAASLW